MSRWRDRVTARTQVRDWTCPRRSRKGVPTTSQGDSAMPIRFSEVTPRAFNPVSVPGLSNEGREAVNAALKAMSNWRNETAEASEKASRQVIDKMAAAATALGWPEQIVDAARTQMQ